MDIFYELEILSQSQEHFEKKQILIHLSRNKKLKGQQTLPSAFHDISDLRCLNFHSR
jgi:hypothetical protein